MKLVTSIDTETFLIKPGVQAPPLVCFQWRNSRGGFGILHGNLQREELELFLDTLLDPLNECVITGHNIAFDMVVIAAFKPSLLPAIFKAYESGRILCSIQAETMLDIAGGRVANLYDLGSVAARYPGVPVADKLDPWRLRYGEIWEVPISEWEEGAIRYALGDVETQLALYLSQEARGMRLGLSLGDDPLIDLARQSAADFWLKLCSTWGVHTEPDAVAVYEQRELEILERTRDALISLGLVRKDKSNTRDTKAAKALMVAVCAAKGLPLPTTRS